jgi:hypothetical protein
VAALRRQLFVFGFTLTRTQNVEIDIFIGAEMPFAEAHLPCALERRGITQ